jgi:hypothetical protein
MECMQRPHIIREQRKIRTLTCLERDTTTYIQTTLEQMNSKTRPLLQNNSLIWQEYLLTSGFKSLIQVK